MRAYSREGVWGDPRRGGPGHRCQGPGATGQGEKYPKFSLYNYTLSRWMGEVSEGFAIVLEAAEGGGPVCGLTRCVLPFSGPGGGFGACRNEWAGDGPGWIVVGR